MVVGQNGKVGLMGQENWVQAQTLPHFLVMTKKLLESISYLSVLN